MDRLKQLLNPNLFETLARIGIGRITELRLRVGRAVTYCEGGVFKSLMLLNKPYICLKSDVDYTVGAASNQALYSVSDAICKGYLFFRGGIRIGVSGEGVTEGGNLTAFKNITSLTLRIPHEVKGCADGVIGRINGDVFKNTLIVAPPAAGKTTMLREIARLTSNSGRNVFIIDERYELAASHNGVFTLDVGANTDVLSGTSKITAYQNVIRAMNPDVIITDEVFTADEVNSVVDATRAGVGVAASVHADSLDDLKNTVFEPLLKVCKAFIVLSKTPTVGTIKEFRIA